MNRYHKQCICMLLAAALFATAAGFAGNRNLKVAHAEEYKNTDREDAIEDIVETVAGVKSLEDREYDKEETVFVIADPSGDPTEIIASEWLKNPAGSSTIKDQSELKDIKNVKGYEEYKKGKDGSITWNANGNDIYYQGTPTEKTPVSVHVTYKLNGQEISPENIHGKSGHVEIRFDYTNTTDETIEVDGRTEHVSIPFTMLTGVILPNDVFSNVQVENARLISEGNNAIVIGYAFPGLYESLKYDEFKDKLDEEQREKAEDLDISDHVVITADAVDFELNSTLTVALPDVLQEVSFTDNIDTDKVKDDMDELADASQELIDGTSDLLDGVNDLKDGTSELKDGTSELKDGTRDLKDGSEDILNGTKDLVDGAGDLKDGICEAYGGTKKLDRGGRKLDDGAVSAFYGSKKLNNGVKKFTSLLDSKSGDIKTLNSLVSYLNSQVSPVVPESYSAALSALSADLIRMDESNERAMQSVDGFCGSVSEDVTDDDKDDTAEMILECLREAEEHTVSVNNALDSLAEMLEDRIDEAEGEKEELRAMLEELGEPDPDHEQDEEDGSDDTAGDVSGNDTGDEEEDTDINNYYKEYYRDYYQKYYEISGQIDMLDELTDILTELEESTESISLSVNEAVQAISGTADDLENACEAQKAGEYSDVRNSKNEAAEMLLSANMINREAASAVWDVVCELEAMELIDTDLSALRNNSSSLKASMTPEELIEKLMSIPDTAQRNAVMQQYLSDPATRIQVAAVIASLDKATRDALAMNAQTTALLNTVVRGVVSGGMQEITDTFTSDSTKKSLAQLSAGAGSLMDGLDTLSDGTGDLRKGLSDLREGMSELSDGGVKLYDGTIDLKDGAQDLDDGAGDLNDGMLDLDDGAGELDDGVGELLDGAGELHDGMIEFNDEGIQKLIDLFGDNVTDMLDRLDAIQKTGSRYQTFSGKSDDMNGSVKFILKTGEIKEE